MPNHRKVAIFWDYENCPPLSSQGFAIVNGIRRIAHIFGCVTTFKTYLDLSSQSSKNSVVFRSELQSSGVSITDCPHNGKKDVVDKMILVDMLAFAIDHKSPATVILIAGDRDYAYALSILRLRRYRVVLIVPSGQNIPQSLLSQASVVLDWNYAILGKRPNADTPPFRQPCSDLDDDIVERLAREIRGLNEHPPVTQNSSHPSSTAHTCSVSTEELLEPPAFQRNTDPGDAIRPAPKCTPKAAVSTSSETPGYSRVASGTSSTAPAHTRSVSAVEPLEPSVSQQNTDLSDAARPTPMCTPKKTAVSAFQETPGHSRVGSGASRASSTTQSIYAVPDIDRGSGSPFTENNALSDECVSIANEIQDAPHDPFARPSSVSPRLERYQNIAEPGSSPVTTGGQSDTTITPKPRHTDSVSAIMDDSILPSDHTAVMAALELDDGGEDHNEILAEVDDYSHIYAMNAVEPHLNEGQAYSPVNDTSPPLTESYGSPTSEESSLSSSVSDSSFSISDGETGPPQATPIISVNGNHSSGFRLPSIEDKIRRLTPLRFLPLINQLLLARSKGIDKASRTIIAAALLKYDKNICKREGSDKFENYASLAEQASLIELGIRDGEAWIALHPNWFKEETTSSLTPSSIHSNSSPTTQHNIETPTSFATTTPPPSFASQTTTLNPNTGSPHTTPGVGDEDSNLSSGYQAPPIIESVEDKIRRLTPPRFLPLINQLLLAKSKGMEKASKSIIDFALFQYDKDNCFYDRAGVNGFEEYALEAEETCLIVCGERDSQAWISLHPKWFEEDTTPKPPAPSSSIRTPSPFASRVATPNPKTPPPPPVVRDEPMPFCFNPLITCLVNVRKGGRAKPVRSHVDHILGPAVYATAGVSTLKEYLALAVQAGIVELGGVDGDAWVMLLPDFAPPTATPNPSTPLPPPPIRTPSPNFASRAATPNPSTPPPPPAVSDGPMPFYFSPLTTLLVNVLKSGVTKPSHSSVGLILGPAVYATAGVSTLKEYLDLAVQAGVVELGVDDYAWVMLHPDVFIGKRSF